jgi:hypothetical protein
MDVDELKWIAEVIEKLQVPQTYNERQRLTKILERVAPAMIKALDYTAVVGFSSYNDKDELVRSGQMCNGCGHDHYFDEGNAKHRKIGVKRDGTGGEECCVEQLFQVLKEEENAEDK